MKSAIRAATLLGSGVALFTLAAPLAANAATAPRADAGDQLEEVIVTAERHAESAQKTAISMSVYTGDEIRAQGVTDVQSLTHVDPSVNFTASNGTAYIAVRGIASTDTTETGDPAVSVSRDGFFTNSSYSLFASMYDVARVEVLKGPQGTLYGRNTAGGVINIVSQQPTRSFGGYAQLELGNYRSVNLEGAVNLPLGDSVQLRVSGVSIYHAGYRNNPSVNPAIIRMPSGDDANNRSGRVQLAFQPWQGGDGLVSVQADNTSGTGDVHHSIRWGTSGPAGVAAPGPTPAVPYGDAGGWPMANQTITSLDSTRYRWQFTQQLPAGLTLTYLGGIDQTQWNHVLDGTAYPAATSVRKRFIQDQSPDTQNEEIRLANSPDSRVYWQVGGFYFKSDEPLQARFQTDSGQFADQYAIRFDYDMQSTSKAGFGQVRFALNDQWRATAGVRYTQDHKFRTGYSVLNLTVASDGFLWLDPTAPIPPGPVVPVFLCSAACIPMPPITTPGNGDVSTSKITYHLGLDWSPTDDTLVYAKYDTGYKAGGFNSNGSAPSVNYEPETVRSIEVGTKNRLLDNRMEANLSLFDMRYSGYQANQFTAAVGGGQGIFNAGSVDIYGAEGEMAWLVARKTRLNLAATFLHTAFSDGCAGDSSVTYLAGITCTPLEGNHLPNSPSLSVVAGIEQAWATGSGGEWKVRLQGKYQSKFYFDIFNHEDLTQRAYALADASLAYTPANSSWRVEAFVRNMADTAVLDNALRNNLVQSNDYQYHPPRVYGLKIGATF